MSYNDNGTRHQDDPVYAELFPNGNDYEVYYLKIAEEVAEMKSRHYFNCVTDEQVETVVVLKRTFEEWALEENLAAIATNCWAPMVKEFGISACFFITPHTNYSYIHNYNVHLFLFQV